MKFTIDKETLNKALQQVNSIVPSKDTQTLLSNVLIQVEDSMIRLTTSDMESTARISMPCTDTESGSLIVRAGKFAEAIQKIKTEKILFQSQKSMETAEGSPEDDITKSFHNIKISGDSKDSVKYDFPGFDQRHFPVIQSIADDQLFLVSSEILREMIQKTVYSISQEDNRYIYNGLCISAEGNVLTLVGTDGRRLSAISREQPSPVDFFRSGEDKKDIVIHKKAVNELLKLLEMDSDVKMGISGRDIFFRVGNAELTSRLLEGNFPDFRRVVPQETNVSITMDRGIFHDALSQVAVMTEQPSYQIRLGVDSGLLTLSASTPEVGKAEMSLPVSYSGDKMEIGFNARYLADILSSLKCDEIEIKLVDAGKPILVRDTKDENFLALIMPMRI